MKLRLPTLNVWGPHHEQFTEFDAYSEAFLGGCLQFWVIQRRADVSLRRKDGPPVGPNVQGSIRAAKTLMCARAMRMITADMAVLRRHEGLYLYDRRHGLWYPNSDMNRVIENRLADETVTHYEAKTSRHAPDLPRPPSIAIP